MKEIASVSHGKFYRAKDETALNEIYDQISKLEKTKIEVFSFYRYTELFMKFLIAGLSLLFLEFILNRSFFGGIPE